MTSVLEKVEATLSKAEKVKVEIVQMQARRDQLIERLSNEYQLDTLEAAEGKVQELDAELVKLETDMETLRVKLNEAISV